MIESIIQTNLNGKKWRALVQIRKFQLDKDLRILEAYLRDQYFTNKNMSSWLPERLHDLIYRMGAQEADGGRERSMDYIFLWEENEELVACILPDGENIYIRPANKSQAENLRI